MSGKYQCGSPGWGFPKADMGELASICPLCPKSGLYALQQKRVAIRLHPPDALWLVPTATHTHTHTASERRITRDGDAMHTPPLARIIVECAMLGAAVVPDRQRTNLPAESAGKFRLHGMRHQKIENRPRLDALEPFERLRVIAYVERFTAGLRMGAHKRMRGFRLHVAGVAYLGCHLLVAGVMAVLGRAYLVVPAEYLAVSDIAGLDALEHLFHRIG